MKLNREADGEYTIQRLVYKQGGVRDQVRAFGTRLGIQLWPQADEDGEEMQRVEVVEDQAEGGSEGSNMDDEQEDEEEDSMDNTGNSREKGENSSGLEGSESEVEERLMDESEGKNATKDKREETQEKEGDEQGKGGACGGTGLLIDLKQFSGSAIWSEEEGGEGKCSDVTAL